MSIVEEEFYRILQELTVVRNEQQIDQFALLWERSLKLGWEGDVVRNAIRDSIFFLARKYGITKAESITYELLLQKSIEYQFLELCSRERMGGVPILKRLAPELLEKGMLRAIQTGQLENVRWFLDNHFPSVREDHLVYAIESDQMAIAKHLLQSFRATTVAAAERIAVSSIKTNWYLGCVAFHGMLDRGKMARLAVEYNRLTMVRFFVRKRVYLPKDCLLLAVEKNYPEMVTYLVNKKYQDVDGAILRCLDFPESEEIMQTLLTRQDSVLNCLRSLALSGEREKLFRLKRSFVNVSKT